MFTALIAGFGVMLASLAGVIAVNKKIGRVIEKNLPFLVSFSAGVFTVVAYHLALESTHLTDLYTGLGWVLAGILGGYLLFELLPDFHHHHDDAHEDHEHDSLDARRILISDGIHNIGDGLLLASTFAVSTSLGIATAVSVFLHELLQEISEFFVLKQAGYSTKTSLLLNFGVSATILLGIVVGVIALQVVPVIEGPIFALTAGVFFTVVLFDLIPHSVRESNSKTDHAAHIAWFVVGLAVMVLIQTSFVHQHGGGENDGHDHEYHEEEMHEHEAHEEETHHDEHGVGEHHPHDE